MCLPLDLPVVPWQTAGWTAREVSQWEGQSLPEGKGKGRQARGAYLQAASRGHGVVVSRLGSPGLGARHPSSHPPLAQAAHGSREGPTHRRLIHVASCVPWDCAHLPRQQHRTLSGGGLAAKAEVHTEGTNNRRAALGWQAAAQAEQAAQPSRRVPLASSSKLRRAACRPPACRIVHGC